MKKAFSSIIVMSVLASCLSLLPGRTIPQQSSLSNAEDMEKRISQLEEKVKMLEAEVSRLKEAQKYIAIPGLPPGMKRIPPGWKKYDYYGQTIYFIPLESALASEKKK